MIGRPSFYDIYKSLKYSISWNIYLDVSNIVVAIDLNYKFGADRLLAMYVTNKTN